LAQGTGCKAAGGWLRGCSVDLQQAEGAMYLNTVLQTFASEKKKFAAEDLYKLNEAIFNLPEEDTIDKKMSAKLFSAVQNVMKAYGTGRYDKGDASFFYDYVALLATMQNQHFFSQKQNKMMLDWLLDAVRGSEAPAEPAKPTKAATGAVAKDVMRLEAENEELEKQIAKLRDLSGAVQVIQTFKLPAEEPMPKANAKAKGKSKGKGKGKGKGKAKAGEGEEAAPTE